MQYHLLPYLLKSCKMHQICSHIWCSTISGIYHSISFLHLHLWISFCICYKLGHLGLLVHSLYCQTVPSFLSFLLLYFLSFYLCFFLDQSWYYLVSSVGFSWNNWTILEQPWNNPGSSNLISLHLVALFFWFLLLVTKGFLLLLLFLLHFVPLMIHILFSLFLVVFTSWYTALCSYNVFLLVCLFCYLYDFIIYFVMSVP